VNRLQEQMGSFDEKNVYYWNEAIHVNGVAWNLFTASYRHGLLMSGLGKAAEQQEKNRNDLTQLVKRYLPGYTVKADKIANHSIIQQFQEYFQGNRQHFSFKICPLGTEFQQKVWQELIRIPYGQTCSYSSIADKIKCFGGQRAVGMANHNNPLGIVIPCHRVIGKTGKLTGYAGGLEIKRLLLDLEKHGKSEKLHG